MKQEIAFFEKQSVEALPSKISENFFHIQEGSGERLSQLFQSVGAICSGITLAFIQGPVFTLIMMGYLPVYIVVICCVGN